MTAQVRDYVFFQGERFELTGFSGSGFPNPQTYSVTLVEGRPTNCYRGFVARYEIKDNQLYIINLTLEAESYPPIERIEAQPADPKIIGWSDWKTYNLNLSSNFTGGILMGKDHAPGGRAPFGLWTPESFHTVIELFFEDGELIGQVDHSEAVRQLKEFISVVKGKDTESQVLELKSYRDQKRSEPPIHANPFNTLPGLQRRSRDFKKESIRQRIERSKRGKLLPNRTSKQNLTPREEIYVLRDELIGDVWLLNYRPPGSEQWL